MGSEKVIIVRAKNITKVFPGMIKALDNASLDIYSGEILALLGENGAGKSTFVKILSGFYVCDSGELLVRVDGGLSRVDVSDPVKAMRYGIALVSQVPRLVDRLTVAENLAVTLASLRLRGFHPVKSTSRVSRLIEEEGERLGFKIDPNETAYNLTYSQKQMVEIFRALLIDAKVLLLDEVLTYLPVQEKRRFYSVLFKLRDEGRAVVLITHKIPEAFEVADRIAVMRNGKVVDVVEARNTTLREVRSMMFGAAARLITQERIALKRDLGNVEIAVEDLYVEDDFGREVVRGVSLEVRKGEVVGIAGVAGNGQRELIEAVAGLRKPVKGVVRIAGVDVAKRGARMVRSLGVGFILDRPFELGCSLDHTILENIAVAFSHMDSPLLDWEKMRALARRIIEEFQVVAPSEDAKMKVLSGGNVMKVIVGREISFASRAIVACNPTRGLDEASASYVRQKIRGKVEQEKLAALIASEDLDELLTICDAIYVANSGKLHGPLDPSKTPRDEFERLMVM